MWSGLINYPAILVSMVAYMLLGMLWYSPFLLGKPWMAAFGKKPEEMKDMQKNAYKGYIVSAICALAMAFVFNVLMNRIGVHSMFGAIKLAGLLWVGLCAASALPATMFEQRSIKLFIIDFLYVLAALILMAVIFWLWR